MRTKCSAFMLIVAVVSFLAIRSHASSPGECAHHERTAHVMTRNMDAGSDFGYVLQAAMDPSTTQVQLLLAITNTFQEMIGSNIPLRTGGIADEIARHRPDLVGLQEITTLRTGAYGQPANTIVVDGLQSLLRALKCRGLHYKAIAVQKNAVVDLPAFDASGNLIMVGFTDYDAVLARTDLPVSEFNVSDIEMQHFSIVLPFSVAGQTIPFTRGWISLQVKERDKRYKFVTTHLETFSPDIQAAQTNELLSGPLSTDLPVILAGDLNSDAHQPSWESGPAFSILQAAGLDDPWSKLHPLKPGLTWPLFAEDPPGPSTPRQRIDLVLKRGQGVRGERIARTGMVPGKSGYASDHAGVYADFSLLP